MKALTGFFKLWLAVLRDSVSLYWLAPLIPLIAVSTELLQHVWEVRAGMFESREAFKALAMDPGRWQWGALKIAGIFVTLLAAARYWAASKAGLRWWNPSGIAWKALAIAFACNLAAMIPLNLIQGRLGQPAENAIVWGITIATLPLLPLLVAPLLGIRDFTLGKAYRSGWWITLRTVLLIGGWFGLMQLVHGWNHRLAIGAPEVAVWALMLWDSVLVGAMAAVMGTGLHHGFVGKDRT